MEARQVPNGFLFGARAALLRTAGKGSCLSRSPEQRGVDNARESEPKSFSGADLLLALYKTNGVLFSSGAAVSQCFNLATCKTRLSVPTWSSFMRHASDTRKPCRNIRNNRQRSRASFRLPLVASISRSTSRPVRFCASQFWESRPFHMSRKSWEQVCSFSFSPGRGKRSS